MNKLPNACPFCGGQVTISRIHCRECDTTFDGRFQSEPFSRLSPEQLLFVETFVRCEGKINRMESELNLSYPTIRNRLHEVIRSFGYEPGVIEEGEQITEGQRQAILEALERGEINAEKAVEMLQARGAS